MTRLPLPRCLRKLIRITQTMKPKLNGIRIIKMKSIYQFYAKTLGTKYINAFDKSHQYKAAESMIFCWMSNTSGVVSITLIYGSMLARIPGYLV